MVKRCVPATIFEIGVDPVLKEEEEQLDGPAARKHIALICALDMDVCTGSDQRLYDFQVMTEGCAEKRVGVVRLEIRVGAGGDQELD
jgi:hypothetical protein